MLNISKNKVGQQVRVEKYSSFQKVLNRSNNIYFKRLLMLFAIVILIIPFLPWTQNITGTGQVTTLKPNQRPQNIQSQIPGRIEEWFVQEGDFVKKGDTILRISEMKSDYFDSKLVDRTKDQIASKSQSIDSYKDKAEVLKRQINTVIRERDLKLELAKNKLFQNKLKVESDSIDWKTAEMNNEVAKKQFDRTKKLNDEGLKALKDVEAKSIKLQETETKLISAQNKYTTSKNNIVNAEIELMRIRAEYNDKIAKIEGSVLETESKVFESEVEVSKLENAKTNYQKRKDLLFITAPQSGYINKALRSGIGETFKEGEKLVNIMPSNYELAVETYVAPIDLPLIHKGEKVRVQFDGWPAIVFSGWPNASYGTYGAEVVAIENFISNNGKYRILLKPDESDHSWPENIGIGSGVKTIALLNDVPVFYEVWRQLNGFPPNFYTAESQDQNGISTK